MTRHIPSRDDARRGGLAIKHGARSAVVLAKLTPEKVEEVKAFLTAAAVRWTEEADGVQIELLARNLVILDQLWSYILQRGAIDSHGRPRGAMGIWTKTMNVINRQLSAMGLTPLARAELGVLKAGGALDLAKLMRMQRETADANGNGAEKRGLEDGQAHG